jgi:hypothetical protein
MLLNFKSNSARYSINFQKKRNKILGRGSDQFFPRRCTEKASLHYVTLTNIKNMQRFLFIYLKINFANKISHLFNSIINPNKIKIIYEKF